MSVATTSQSASSTAKLGAIQAIRGYAALFVALGHLYYAFFSPPDMILAVGEQAAAELLAIDNNMLKFWSAIPRSSVWVAVFFLISGFVIEISVSKIGPIAFLTQRAFRIYSVFWLACLFHIFANIFVFDLPLPERWINNAFLVTNYSLSPVSWTLIVEMHFYLLIALLVTFKLPSVGRIYFFSTLFFIYYVALTAKVLPAWAAAWIGEVFYFSWMSLGASIYLAFRERRDEKQGKGAALRFFFVSIVVFIQYQLALHNPFGVNVFTESDTIALLSAISIFVGAIFLYPDYSDPVSDFFGRISYPLYCLHFPIGWMGHYLFVGKFGFSPLFSLSVVLPFVIAFSYITHILVEAPANLLGKKLSRLFGSRQKFG